VDALLELLRSSIDIDFSVLTVYFLV
jgi:hypothetical protein